tara:strand:+ start:449 stop:1540 length:1092 start_codon:yes stop_codon:yes gene_type:complete
MKLFKTFKNKKVIVTGHTGFKGSWLTLWLLKLGANVMGISKNIITNPSHFVSLGLKKNILHRQFDIKDLKKLEETFDKFQPSFVFHLAAQSLVRKSYNFPIDTINSNTIGTLNVLESLKKIKKNCSVVLITSDKVYRNLELNRGYNENDILGGHDPYSASKAAAENIIYSYIKSYFNKKNSNISISIARAGNVIGGGDWSEDRIIPDCIKSWSKNKIAVIRNPNSTRPWQHVLEAVGGYLILASKLNKNRKLHGQVFNFGPNNNNNLKVNDLIKKMQYYWRGIKWKKTNKIKKNLFESKLLKLNSSKAKKLLNWNSILKFDETIELVSSWYKNFYLNRNLIKKNSLNQITFYEKSLKERLGIK